MKNTTSIRVEQMRSSQMMILNKSKSILSKKPKTYMQLDTLRSLYHAYYQEILQKWFPCIRPEPEYIIIFLYEFT